MSLLERFRTKKSCTTYPYCDVGSGISATLKRRSYRNNHGSKEELTVSGDEQHPSNFGRLCVKGSALGETLGERGRLLHPRLHGRDCDWDSAMDFMARQFNNIIKKY